MSRKNRRGKSKRKSHSNSTEAGTSHTHWSTQDRGALQQYLQDYRDRVEAVYLGRRTEHRGDEDEVRIIGGVVLPALTEEVLEEPFLQLPSNLSPKQRKLVHDCCLETDLYHASFGSTRHSRTIVVSLYSDGLEYFQSTEENVDTHRPSVYSYSPWYCRNHNIDSDETKMNSVEKHALRQISKLLDNPRTCLRDGLDVVTFDPTTVEDLSEVPPPSSMAKTNTSLDDPTFFLVDSADKMVACVRQLNAAQPTEIAFDLEAYNPSKYSQLCCLLQITCNTLDVDFIIDTLAPGVWEHVSGLAPLFADPCIVKVGHAIGGLDIRSLHRDFGIFCVNAFDTYEAAKLLDHLPGQGLAFVCQSYGLRQAKHYTLLKEKYQACDWRVRPLTHAMIQYARYDVRFLLPLRRFMMRDLVRYELANKGEFSFDLPGATVAELAAQPVVKTEERRVLKSGKETPKKKNPSFFSFFQAKISKSGSKDRLVSSTVVSFDDEEFPTSPDGMDGNGSQTNSNSDQGEGDEGEDCSDDDGFYFTPAKHSPPSSVATEDELFYFTPDNSVTMSDGRHFGKNEKPFSVCTETLREQTLLMDVIVKSQERCKSFFSFSKEPHGSNSLFISLLQRAGKKQIDWTNENTKLYADLVAWRSKTANELQCLPGFIASLEFLAGVAWKRPLSFQGLTRIASDLPEPLADHEYLCQELLNTVRASFSGIVPEEQLYLFATNERRSRRTKVLLRAMLTTTVCAGLAYITLLAVRQRKLKL